MRWTSSSGPGGITPAGKPTPRQKECSAASRPSGVCKRVNGSLCRYSWVTCGHETHSIASTDVNTHIGQVASSWSRTQEATLRSHRRRPIHSNLVNLRVKLLLGHQAPRMHTRELAGFGVANDLAHFLTFLLASPPLIDRDEKQKKKRTENAEHNEDPSHHHGIGPILACSQAHPHPKKLSCHVRANKSVA